MSRPAWYTTIHKRINIIRGGAKYQRCVDCGFYAHQWSHIHDTDPMDTDNYEPRCYSCHAVYDRGCIAREPIEHKVSRKPLPKDWVEIDGVITRQNVK